MRTNLRLCGLLVLLVAMSSAQVIVPVTSECATSVDGSVVGTPNPLNPPLVSAAFTGTLSSGNYFVEIVWFDAASHVTLASPEVQVQLVATGSLQVSEPSSGLPSTASGMQVYIGTASGTETLQGSVTGSSTYTQSVALVNGAPPPATNTTLCQIIANDAGWPTGTGYVVSLTDPAGATMPGYPMQWQLLGPGNTINLSKGLPFYNGVVNYPVPILARPYNHAPQSISGPLSMTNYNVINVGHLGVATALPAWGVDVEGVANQGAINANSGYLFNGAAPVNHVLLGNGTYYVDSATIPYGIISGGPGLFYQTLSLNGTAQTQRPVFNFSSLFTAGDSSSPSQTNVGLNAPGTGTLVATYGSAPGSSTALAGFDGNGNIVPSAATGSNAPQKISLSSPVTITGQTIVLTEVVTFPAGGGSYRADVRYGLYLDGSNSCGSEVIDTTNSRPFALDYSDSNGGGGHNGLAASEISTSTYAAGATATFTLQVQCNGSETATVHSSLFTFTPAEASYL